MGPLDSRCFDSNIVIDWFNGVAEAGRELAAVDHPVISVITWVEVLAGLKGSLEDALGRDLLQQFFRIVPVDLSIAEVAIRLRRERGIKLPDAIIHATALQRGVQLVTRNTKDFSPDDPTIRVPYTL